MFHVCEDVAQPVYAQKLPVSSIEERAQCCCM